LNTVKYPIEEVDLKNIPVNRMLSAGLTPSQKVQYEQSIRRYGLLTPIVLVKKPAGTWMTLTGEHELEVLKGMEVTKTEAFVTKLQDPADADKVILLLSSFPRGLNPITEGLLLQELLHTGGYTQKQLAHLLMKSRAWVCKRLSLAGKLHKEVAEMVLARQLCPAAAQSVARLPREDQPLFATQVYTHDLPKSMVERLVRAYNHRKTPETCRREILHNPCLAARLLVMTSPRRCADLTLERKTSIRLEESLRLILSLLTEMERSLASLPADAIVPYGSMLSEVSRAMARSAQLLEHGGISPGKSTLTQEQTGGAAHGVC